MTTAPTLDQAKAEAFGSRMMDMCVNGMLMSMTSIGHEVGLFEAMAGRAPATSEAIADAAGLDERYVREWLACMASAAIVEYHPGSRTFRLPDEHAGSLTRAAGPMNLALWAFAMTGFGEALDELVASFRNGGGVPYSAFTKFPALMAAVSGAQYDASLISVVLPLVPGLVDRLNAGVDVADVGCGSGHAINLMAKAFPRSRFTGFDFSEVALEAARREASAMGLSNAAFEARDVATLSGPPRYDFVTAFDAIHDQAQPRRVLKGIAECLRPDGTFLCVDIAGSSTLEENFSNPMAPMMYAISTMHCMTVSLALGGEGLGTMWGEQKAHELLGEAGFTSVETKRIESDFDNNYYVCHTRAAAGRTAGNGQVP
jgi:2-polyprenyl-3-methyl-5-hydroxy-6-metoxy-1,4-benzoquinol methylase